MTSNELRDHVEEFITKAGGRITGTGNEQYSRGDDQVFETLPLDDLFDWTEEELLDIACYSVMLWIRIKKIKTAMQRV